MNIYVPHSHIDFKKRELKTLEYIDRNGFFYNDFPELAAALYKAYNTYRSSKANFDFDFVSDFEMEVEKRIRRVVIHAQVKGNYEYTTYSMGICGENDSPELIRRFHFDYVHADDTSEQRVPRSHLQYGGKSGGESNGKQFLTGRIENWLSVPRLNYPPINLALLLDLVFCEFYSEKTDRIVESPEWRLLVMENESFVWGHYYKIISDHIHSQAHKTEKLVRDICYGSNTH